MHYKTILISLAGLLTLIGLVFQACKKDEDESNQIPNCTITSPSAGEEFAENETVTITVLATDSDGTITEVIFYVDGLMKTAVNTAPYKYEWNTSGENTGSHTLKSTCVDNDGASASDEVMITLVSDNMPISSFSAAPTSGSVPLTVNFTDESTNSPISWNWDFGDGNNSTEQNPSHIYNEMGVYEISLTVANNNASDTETKTNFICATDAFTDTRDGQTYTIIKIGNQTWFAENLNYIAGNSWCYDDKGANCDSYGRLYDWQTALIACPSGWHLASDGEWNTLQMYLGMSQSDTELTNWISSADVGKKLKSKNGWDNNGNGIDEVGFSALPGGWRIQPTGTWEFKDIGRYGVWWSSSEYEPSYPWARQMGNGNDGIYRDHMGMGNGLSVRCVKDD